MKQFAFFLLLVVFISCNKNENPQSDNSFAGKWIEFENYISPGTAWYWQPAKNVTVQINSNLSYTSDNDSYFWGRSGKIENLTDSTFLLRSPAFASPLNCNYKLEDGVLEVWYPCIEGCGSRFRKIN
ncbi:MAG: hypothetical protein K2X48_15230 [Chitinophagaceae bacterium]|nr:hypothetical protein [Chitinophagaceae bacterium]